MDFGGHWYGQCTGGGSGGQRRSTERLWGAAPHDAHPAQSAQLSCTRLSNCALPTLGLPPQVLSQGPDLSGQGTDARFCVPQRVRPPRTCHNATTTMSSL